MHRRLLLPIALCVLPVLAACQPVSVDESRRSIVASGEGELAVPPEVATVNLSIEARHMELAAAQAQAGQVVDAVLELTDALEIPRAQVQSLQIHVQPEFNWNDGKQDFRGYLVQRTVRVRLEQLEKLGPLLERGMGAGVNSVSSPILDVRDPRRLHREVLQRAAADARANAEALAKALDVALGEVLHVQAVENVPVPMQRMEMRAMSAADAGFEQTYEAGRIIVRTTVQAEFELR